MLLAVEDGYTTHVPQPPGAWDVAVRVAKEGQVQCGDWHAVTGLSVTSSLDQQNLARRRGAGGEIS